MPILRSASHWGAFRAVVEDGRLVDVLPFEHDPEPNALIKVWPEMLTSPLRVARPVVRKGWLENDGGKGRGEDEFVEIEWDEAIERVAGELRRVRDTFGNAAIFGGSYGWSSAGRLHHARSLVRRFLTGFGGFTDQVTNYSYGAAMAFLPRVVGRGDAIGSHLTSLSSIREHADIVLAMGGIPDRNWLIQAGGSGTHGYGNFMETMGKLRFINISPRQEDVTPADAFEWMPIRPNTDTALLLALMQAVIAAGREDKAFLDRYCHGFAPFRAYLMGETDGIAKTPEWAEHICGVPAETIRALAEELPGKRVMLTATWSLQRARHGEQPYWAMIALSAVLGQIGLPGGGFAFGYGSSNGMGNPRYETPLFGPPVGRNPVTPPIPVARVTDMLLNPGGDYRFNGKTQTYPDIKLIYWAGGNPFHHQQDLNRLREGFRKPETVIVHECYWTATARHADIVLPATTALERNDIGGASRDPYILAMHKLVEPVGEARNDFAIFAELAKKLDMGDAFTDGLDEAGWLDRAWESISGKLQSRGITAPVFSDFWEKGYFHMPEPNRDYVMFEAFREDPDANRLETPSGRIELFSQALRDESDGVQPGHPAWLDPEEWLGAPLAETYPLHLLTPQPGRKLHGQLDASAHSMAGKVKGLERVDLHPSDAARRGIADGDAVRLFNSRGSCFAVARVTETIVRGVAVLPTGGTYDPDGMTDRNSNPNVLTRDIGTSEMGQGSSAQSCLIEIERVEGDTLPTIRTFSPPPITPRS
ncbi:molybdopterin-dependent oxidoreductase [Neorhizobium sp. IRS_2294]|uniref:molybdopterin-dependent oxidoreductase n=1 Tax=unclassified Neorhizobium TaxID=2629175 RepID=UPI003D28DC6E